MNSRRSGHTFWSNLHSWMLDPKFQRVDCTLNFMMFGLSGMFSLHFRPPQPSVFPDSSASLFLCWRYFKSPLKMNMTLKSKNPTMPDEHCRGNLPTSISRVTQQEPNLPDREPRPTQKTTISYTCPWPWESSHAREDPSNLTFNMNHQSEKRTTARNQKTDQLWSGRSPLGYAACLLLSQIHAEI